MIFLTMNRKIEEVLKQSEDKRIDYTSYFLLEKQIKPKNLKNKYSLSDDKFLSSYIEKLSHYPMVYKGPLYCYLFTKEEFEKMNFLSKNYKDKSSIFSVANDNIYIDDIPIERMRSYLKNMDYTDSSNYVKRKFRKLIESYFDNKPCSSIVLNWRE